MSLRKRVYEVLEIAKPGDRLSRAFDLFILGLIAVNVLASTLVTVPEIAEAYGGALNRFETASVAVFTAEYLARLWSAPESARFRGALVGRTRFVLSPMAVIDLLAVMPFYLPVLGVDLRFVRVLRLFRLFRILKMARYSSSLKALAGVLRSRKQQLIIALTFALTMLLFAASLLYYVERDAQPKVFASIPHALWWGVCTLTTVGYGDVHPITPLGKLFGGMIAFVGVGMFALPAGILAGGFAEWARTHGGDGGKRCPHCGKGLGAAGADKP